MSSSLELSIFGLKRSNKDFWEEIYATHATAIEDTYNERLHVGYRLTREMSVLKGITQPHQPLAEGTAVHPCPFENPVTLLGYQTASPPTSSQQAMARGYLIAREGTTLVPYQNQPEHQVMQFVDAARQMSMYLGITRGTPTDRYAYKAALQLLLSPKYSHAAWPTKEEILNYEDDLLVEVMDNLVAKGDYPTIQYIRDKYGFSRQESKNLVTMAAREANRLIEDLTIEDHRKMLIHRLDDFAGRARQAGQLTAELGSLKQLAVVTGITKLEQQDGNQDFIQVARTKTRAVKDVNELPPPAVRGA